jgi:beta-glucosidase/6-phospho-beta-glucosidase/beta-galactosidase
VGFEALGIYDGVSVRAYDPWSLLDDIKWVEGYAQRFGIGLTSLLSFFTG